ncbi:hypothetical protein Hamer_G028820 [Homarus americanus]|uniref:Uncharacterized protein n=1 Tax=Homarus americanus TaxID=6706 RepID=A0A8J5JX82_HOMAM|nr:hypothetical protein Hamer_G028820 [Homarus americanus]
MSEPSVKCHTWTTCGHHTAAGELTADDQAVEIIHPASFPGVGCESPLLPHAVSHFRPVRCFRTPQRLLPRGGATLRVLGHSGSS